MSRYALYITPEALNEARNLPGSVRQRARRAIAELADEPRPPSSKALDMPDSVEEVRRLRLDAWRIVYIVYEIDRAVDVVGVRRRPPYDYADLAGLLERAG